MSGNARDQNLALQAAEAALRDGERDINNAGGTQRIVASTDFVAACTAALCTEGQPLTNLDDPLKSAFFGQYTAYPGTAFNALAHQPRYMVEKLGTAPAQNPSRPAGTTTTNFRITGKGYGVNANTVVILQSIYQMDI
jgi:type IV pilus assembly protein PilX